ncbi:MAG: tRNA (adenosine(37)-N6)-dimethylallyltransferase MiaA [Desulfuromonadales bacterium]|nr:tRNA (adenosine(37)-N6)-dimethylallyltransferase MiaA [Desulfuromonadales bacterium]
MPPLVVLCGPTAAGKTAAALALAEHFDLEVISADSRQVYRLMDIGTAKPSAEERAQVPHHLLDVVWPDEPFDVARFAGLAGQSINGILARGRLPLLVGGTGLYIRALTEGLAEAPGADPLVRRRLETEAEAEGNLALHHRLTDVDPAAAALLHPNDRMRIVRALEVFELTGRPLSSWQQAHGFRERRYRLLKIALSPPRPELYRRIDARAAAMLDGGLVEETAALLHAGYDPRLKSLQTIGYRETMRLIEGNVSREEALAELQQATRRYAKRQLTWFRADRDMIWVDSVKDSDKIQTLIAQFHAA